MIDMLVNLLKLAPLQPTISKLEKSGVSIRSANPWEMSRVREFVEKTWTIGWADEVAVGFAHQPVSVIIAVHEGEVVGFCAYECTRRNFVGPMGVSESMRGKGIGEAVLLAGLWGLREMGYVYAIIGGVGPVEFYKKTCGAIPIPDSSPGIYTDMLKKRR